MAADPVGQMAHAANGAANGVIGTTKNVITGTWNYAVKPAATIYGALSAYSMLDGGVGALASTA